MDIFERKTEAKQINNCFQLRHVIMNKKLIQYLIKNQIKSKPYDITNTFFHPKF